jgi:hypothetical protein
MPAFAIGNSFRKSLIASLRQDEDETKTTWPRLVFAGHFARPETGMLFLDLTQRGSGSTEYGGQFYVNGLKAKAFETEKFDNKSLLRFFYLVEQCIFNRIFVMILKSTTTVGRVNHILENYSV